jgi:uncharacterized membrane protein/uncharacterized membrane-anchored protein
MPLPQGFREWLAKESQLWQEQGVLQPGQRDQILSRYPEEEGGIGRMAFVLRTFGVLLLGAALLLVIGHNWDDLSRTGRLLTVIAGLCGLQGVGLWYLHRDSRQGSVLGALAGCIMFGAAIALTGQIYHLDAHQPDAFLAWCIGSLPFAILLDSSLLYVGSLLLACCWLGAETTHSFGSSWHGLTSDPRPLFFLLIAPAAVAAYRRFRPLLAGAVAWSLVFAWISREDLSAQYMMLPLIIASLHAVGDARARGWRFIGGVGATIATIAIGQIRNPMTSHLFRTDSLACWLILGGAAVALGLAIRSRQFLRIWPAGIALTILLIGLGYELAGKGHDLFQVLMIATGNVATLILSVWLIRLGLTEGRLRPYVYGSLVFLTWLIVRYVDISKDLGMLTMAGFFALLGVILFVLARVWKTQREPHQPEVSPDYRPAWLESAIAFVTPHRRSLLWTAVVLQVATIGWMVWHHQQPGDSGERIVLRCRPVDPRDLLKGEYVILRYDFSNATEAQHRALLAEFKSLHPGPKDTGSGEAQLWNLPADSTVFVPLTRTPEGTVTAGDPTLTRPSQGLYLQGLTRYTELRFGIEAYYVKEGNGKKWEDLARKGELAAEIGVLPDGRAGLVSLKAMPKVVRTTIDFRTLERFSPAANRAQPKSVKFASNRTQSLVISDARTFAQDFQPAPLDGQNAVAPDFTKELVLSYALTEKFGEMWVNFVTVERAGPLLIATVRTNYDKPKTPGSIPQAAIIVRRAGIETVEFREPSGQLIHREAVK